MVDYPLITIITPSYMQGDYIEDTILSVYNQSYKNIEHIILDSCSSDGTDEVVRRYLGKYNILYIREKDSGQSNAINKGLDLASGEIVCWLNSDDLYFNCRVLETIVELFHSSPVVHMVTGDGYYVDKELNLVAPITLDSSRYVAPHYMKIFDAFLQPSTFWLRNEIRLDENMHYAFDWKYFLEYYKQKKSILYVKNYFSCYRLHETGKTVTDTSTRKKEIIAIVKDNEVGSVTLLWNYFVYYCYILSERTGLGIFRNLVKRGNSHLAKITDKKVFSP